MAVQGWRSMRAVVVAGWVVLLGGGLRADTDWGPLYSRDTTVDGARRLRVLGPFFERQEAEDLSFAAVRPVWNRIDDSTRTRTLTEVLWPVGMFKDLGADRSWRFLPAYGNNYDTARDDSRRRFTILPLYFSGRDAAGETYRGLFPLWGSMHEWLGYDEVDFRLFPLYLRSVKKDQETTSWLWPIYSRTRGGDVDRFRVFPLYGRSTTKDRWSKRFILWPFWNQVEYLYPGDEGGGFILFPLYGSVHTQKSAMHWILPPLFKWGGDETERVLHCPWPIVTIQHGKEEKVHVWPLWGRRERNNVSQGFYLFPLGWWSRAERPDSVRTWSAFMPLFYRDATVTRPTDGTAPVQRAGTFKIWPLWSYQREDDVSRLRVLDLWPGRPVRGIEKNFSPFWTLYARTGAGAAMESELLWGLYRHRRDGQGGGRLSVFPLFETERGAADGGSARWSVLKGLCGYARTGDKRQFRFMYFFKIGGGSDAAGAVKD